MKRPNSPETNNGTEAGKELVASKKAKTFEVVEANPGSQEEPPRMSNMKAPIMLLTGHAGEIYTVIFYLSHLIGFRANFLPNFQAKFHPEGNVLASAGYDRQVFFWNVYGECENFHVISGCHSGAILDLHFSPETGSYLYTASTDKTVGVFDVPTGTRIKRLKGHTT